MLALEKLIVDWLVDPEGTAGGGSKVIFIRFYLQRRKREYNIIFQKKISSLQFVTQR